MDIEIINALIQYADTTQSPFVDYAKFLDSLKTSAPDPNVSFLQKIDDHRIEIIPSLVEWEYKGNCTLNRKEGTITSVIIHSILEDKIKHRYYLIENDPHLPFPTEEIFPFPIPAKIIETFDINTGFVNLLGSVNSLKQSLAKITFPYSVQNLVVPKEYLKSKLLECCIYKIRNYLQEKMNVSYITSRLEVVISGTLSSIKSMINDIVTKPKKAIAQLYEVDDVTFRFWTQLSNIMIQDFKEKKDKLIDEHGYCQSAYIIGLYIGYQKTIIQKKYQKSLDIKQLEVLVKRPPYAFTLEDLYDLKDSKGVRYSEKYSREFIHDFIHKATQVENSSELPFLIRIKVDEGKEYFIQKEIVIPLFLNKVTESSRLLKFDLSEEWQLLLKNNIKIPSMKDDTAFGETLKRRIRTQYPLLFALLNPHLLYITKLETNITQNNITAIERCFTKGNKLKTLPELLDLNRATILKEVKTILPLWYTIPLIKHLFFLIKWLFGKGRQEKKETLQVLWEKIRHEFKRGMYDEYPDLIKTWKDVSGYQRDADLRYQLPKTQEKVNNYKQALTKIKEQLIGVNIDIDQKLKELAEKWNPLFDPVSKAHLVEDVNALIRDFLRSIKRTFKVKPPTVEQIHNLAETLAVNKNLSEIKRKESLRIYIETYMIKLLDERFIFQLL